MIEFDPGGSEILRVRHPLALGRSWTATWNWRTPEGGDGDSTVTWKVIVQERISVGPHELESFHIEGSGLWKGLLGRPLWFDRSHDRDIPVFAGNIATFEGKSFIASLDMEIRHTACALEPRSPAARS